MLSFFMQFILQKPFHTLKDAELLKQTLSAAKTEKKATLALLDYLVEIDARRLYATVNACSSSFDYLVKELGFSHPAASDRVNTVRLIRAVPPVKEHLETGKLTLTSAAQIQRFVNAEQKVSPKGRAVPTEVKLNVIEACLGKSKREVEKTLFEKHSEPARILTQENVRVVTSTRSEIKFTVDETILKKLTQLKDLIGNPPLEKILDQALDALLVVEKKKRGVEPRKSAGGANQNKPLEKNTEKMATSNQEEPGRPADSAAGKTEIKVKTKIENIAQINSRFIPIDLKRFVFARSKGQCEFVDPRTKTRCHSAYRLQIDHQIPIALSGKTQAANLRHLCFSHNLRMAVEAGLRRPQTSATNASRH